MLLGKKIVVTGGSKGIGQAVVAELCQLGATVLTCARNSDSLDKCIEEWKKVYIFKQQPNFLLQAYLKLLFLRLVMTCILVLPI